MSNYETRITKITIVPKGEPLFSETVTDISIDDEAAGEFVVIRQSASTENGKIAISPEEWPAIRDAVERMIKECRE